MLVCNKDIAMAMSADLGETLEKFVTKLVASERVVSRNGRDRHLSDFELYPTPR
jgi:hypothetical protein